MIRTLVTYTIGGERGILVEQHVILRDADRLTPKHARRALRRVCTDHLPNNATVWEAPPFAVSGTLRGYRIYPNSAFLVSRIVKETVECHQKPTAS